MQGWVDLVGLLHTEMVWRRPKTVTHPGTNRARRALTSFIRRTPLTTTPRRQPTADCGSVEAWLFMNYTVRQKKRTAFLLWISFLICNVTWQNLVLLLLVNIIVDVTCLISGIYTNLCIFLCKKCDVVYVVNRGVNRRTSRHRLVFQFHYYAKFFTHAKIK